MTKTNPKEAGIVEVVDKQAMDGAILDAVARSFMVLQCRSEQIVVIAIREEVVRVGNIDAVYVFNRTSHHPQIVHTGQQLPRVIKKNENSSQIFLRDKQNKLLIS